MLSADTLIYRLRESGGAMFRFRMEAEELVSNDLYMPRPYNTFSILYVDRTTDISIATGKLYPNKVT